MTLSLAQTKPIVAALRQTALFAHVPLRALTSLAEQATELQFKQGDSVYEAGVIADAFYVVRSGRLQDYGSDAQGKPTLRRQLRAGDTFGETAVVLGQETRSRVLVGEATTLARIGAPELHAALAKSTAFRRALYSAAHPELEAIHAAATAHDDHNVDLVALHAPLGWPLEKLAAALGEALVVNHGDRVALLHVTTAPVKKLRKPPAAGPDGLIHLDVGTDPEAFQSTELAAALGKATDYLLLDLSGAGDAARKAWTAQANKVVTLRLPGETVGIGGVRDSVPVCEAILMPQTGSVFPNVLPAGAARLRMNEADLGKPLAQWSTANRRALDRWARHVSDRTVGLALGGGGAWGYAHVALIEELLARNIPIDIVAGVSFGSMVGAYYCAGGEAGLRKLVSVGPRLKWIVQGAFFSSSVIGNKVTRDVGDHWLEDLDVVFLPVACDIAAAETIAIRGVHLALGTTASGSFPTVFSPTTAMDPVAGKRRRYVDGGISDNVPDGPILAEGADLVIASNIVPPPAAQSAPKQLLPGKVGAMLQALNPLQRMNDGYRSTFMLFHTAGDSEQLAVDAVLHTKPTGFLPIAFDRAHEIMAQSRVAAAATADRALERWRAMQGRGYSA